MKNYKKGFIIPLIWGIVASLAIGLGSYIFINQQAKAPITNQVVNTVATTSDSSITTISTSTNQTATHNCVPEGGIYSAPLTEADLCCGGLIQQPDPQSQSGTTGKCVKPQTANSNLQQVSNFGYTFNTIAPSVDFGGASETPDWKIEIKKDGKFVTDVTVKSKVTPDLFTVSPDGKFVALRTSSYGGTCIGNATLIVLDLKNFSSIKVSSDNDLNGQNQTDILDIKWISNSSIEVLTHYGLNLADGVTDSYCGGGNKAFTKKIKYDIQASSSSNISRNYALGDFDTLYDDFNFDGLQDKIVVANKNNFDGYRGAYPHKDIYVQTSSGNYVLSDELTTLINGTGWFTLMHSNKGENRILTYGANSAFEEQGELYEVIPNHGLRLDFKITEQIGYNDIPDGKIKVTTENLISSTSTTETKFTKNVKYYDIGEYKRWDQVDATERKTLGY